MVCEIGDAQGAAVLALADAAGLTAAAVEPDLAGRDRILLARRHGRLSGSRRISAAHDSRTPIGRRSDSSARTGDARRQPASGLVDGAGRVS